MTGLIIIVVLFALLWAVLIRPQRARQQAQRRLLESVEPGDEILTLGGLYGIVQEIDEEDDLVVEVAEGVHVRIARRGVAAVVKPDEGEEGEDEDEQDEEDQGEDASNAATARDGPGPQASREERPSV